MLGVISVIFGTIVFHIFANTFQYPFHASCLIEWQVGMSCENVRHKLRSQINYWDNNNCPSTDESCTELPCGMRCKYKLTESKSINQLTCTHKTVIEDYIDYLVFNFSNSLSKSNECIFQGFSKSGVWYAILDYGVNYCNLRNLLDGSGISSTYGFVEKTNSSVCTMYDKKNCNRY